MLAVSCAAGLTAALKLESCQRFCPDVPSITKMGLYNTLVVLYLARWSFPRPFIIKYKEWIEHYINMADERRPRTRHGKLISKFHLTFSLFSENIAITYKGFQPTCLLPSAFFWGGRRGA
jgi:hypothetical protein